jgi:phosphatidate cytidylyltransferase
LKLRVLTAILAVPLVIGIVSCLHPGPLWVLVALAAFLCAVEAEDLFGQGGSGGHLAALVVLSLFLASGVLNYQPADAEQNSKTALQLGPVIAGAAALWLAGMTASVFRARGGTSVPEMALSACWYAAPLVSLLFLHPASPGAAWNWSLESPILLILLPVWAGDTAGMLVGRAWGRNLLAPAISPKKTWEGAIGNFGAASLAGLGVGALIGYGPVVGLLCGAAVGLIGQLGDLFESSLKRAVGKKDSGNLLPGHGGILDRIDALIASVIPVWLILWLSGSL